MTFSVSSFTSTILLLTTLSVLTACEDDGKELVSTLTLNAAAKYDYDGKYASDALNKAFAASPDGAFAAAHSFPTEDLAAAAALINCNDRVLVGQLECVVYDLNGSIIAGGPMRLRRK